MTVSSLDKIETFDSWAQDYYEPSALRYYDAAIARMVKVLAPSPGSTVLDAGCGTGVHSIRVARLGHRMKAVDISDVVLQTARRNAQQAGVDDKIDFEQADLTKLQFADSTFENIFSWGVIIHIPEIDQAIRELVRVLQPGGRLALQITNSRAWDYSIETLGRALLRKPLVGQEKLHFGVGGWCDMHGGKLYNWRTDIKAVTKLMDNLGLKRIHRSAAEFTELQRRVPLAPARTALRLINRGWFKMHLPAGPAITNLLVFQKPS
jgi:ubiquinone/menaquinone biosynthesis C-methylase UbiE